jgi:hypothetical protein
MLERDMRERVERVLQTYRRRALVSVLGIGISVGGCATTESSSRRDSTPRRIDAGAESEEDDPFRNVHPMYMAPERYEK